MIPRTLLVNYSAALDAISLRAQKAVRDAVAATDLSDVARARDEIISAIEPILEQATDASASVASSFYDACRLIEIGSASGIDGSSCRVPDATAGAVRAFMQVVVDGAPAERLAARLCERADYEVRKAANMAVVDCGERDSL